LSRPTGGFVIRSWGAPTGTWVASASMGQTIRDVIKRRFRRRIVVGLVGWLVFTIAASQTHKGAPIGLPLALLLLLGIGTFAGALLMVTFIRCPSCRGQLHGWATTIVFPTWSHRQKNWCPCCGVNLDEPLTDRVTL
jgi:hypothetical protein